MKKVLDLLEKNVQWLAMGLGALYLLWMVWTYVINSPVKVTGVAPNPLSPGDVDSYIADNVANARVSCQPALTAPMKKSYFGHRLFPWNPRDS